MVRHAIAAGAMLFTLVAAPARALVLDGVSVPDSLPLDGRVLRLNGAGLRSVPVLGIAEYIAALYLPAPSHDPAAILAMPAPKVVVIFFRHSASKAQIEESFRKGERINCADGQCDKSELPDFERLVAAVPAVKVGDTATYVYEPNRLRVLANGQLIGDFADGALSRQLLRGFLGEHPPTETLKRQMLGLAEE